MKKNNRLIDELLNEHARAGSGADEQFLEKLDQRLDEEMGEGKASRSHPGSRWALGASVAACLALSATGVYIWQNQTTKDIIAYHDVVETPELPSPVAKEAAVDDRSVLAKDEVASRQQKSDAVEGDAGATTQSLVAPATEESLGGSTPTPPQAAEAGLASRALNSPRIAVDMAITPQDDLRRSKKVAGGALVGSISAEGATGAVFGDDKGGICHPPITCPPPRPMPPIICPPYPMPPIDPPAPANPIAGERYGELIENKFIAPVDEKTSLSTFAVDVDTASYANVRRMINAQQTIPKDAVRIEEMINYFDYQYPQPVGAHPFSVQVDAMACPWEPKHRLVRIGLQGKELVRSERAAANLVFLLDVSGSMNSEDKLPLLKSSMSYLLEELNEKDTVSIVVYAGSSGLALPPTKVDAAGRQKIQQAMNQLSAGGSTAGGEGIKLAYEIAKQNFVKNGVNRILLATDGDFNVGVFDTDALTKLVKSKAKEGTYISVLGFGQGNINDAMMESITNNGNGNYHYIDTIKEGRKVLLEDMMGTMVTIAKDVKVQVVMNPAKVKAYRLIGYSNRMLPPEAFLEKRVDAGEIGSGHRVTALYEIIPADGIPFGPKIDASRYFKKAEAVQNQPQLKLSNETLFVKLAYKLPTQSTEDESTYLSLPYEDKQVEATADLKFASAVGLFGMVLRDSEHKGSGTLDMVESLAKQGIGTDGKGQRDEFIKLVQKLKTKE